MRFLAQTEASESSNVAPHLPANPSASTQPRGEALVLGRFWKWLSTGLISASTMLGPACALCCRERCVHCGSHSEIGVGHLPPAERLSPVMASELHWNGMLPSEHDLDVRTGCTLRDRRLKESGQRHCFCVAFQSVKAAMPKRASTARSVPC